MHREWYRVKPYTVTGVSTTWQERIKHKARHTIQAVEARLTAEIPGWVREMKDSIIDGPLWA